MPIINLKLMSLDSREIALCCGCFFMLFQINVLCTNTNKDAPFFWYDKSSVYHNVVADGFQHISVYGYSEWEGRGCLEKSLS